MTLTDRERVLTEIIKGLLFRYRPYGDSLNYPDNERQIGYSLMTDISDLRTHFAPYNHATPQIGELVVCMTMATSEYSIGYVVAPNPDGYCIRAIGTDDYCNVYNEMFVPIRGVHPRDLLEREERALYVKIGKAFRRIRQIPYSERQGKVEPRYNGLRFDGPVACLSIVPRYGYAPGELETIPHTIRFTPRKRMTIKELATAILTLSDAHTWEMQVRPGREEEYARWLATEDGQAWLAKERERMG